MSKQIPRYVVRYYGGAHNFRTNKRTTIKQILKLIADLRIGCAYFPSGDGDVRNLTTAAERIKADISIKNWGK